MRLQLSANAITAIIFVVAAALSLVFAGGASSLIQMSARRDVKLALETAGQGWVTIGASGLEVRLSGTAPSEAARFRALTVTGGVIDANRIVDMIEVEDKADIAPPDFSVELLRNDAGLSLVGLMPASPARDTITDRLAPIVGDGTLTDLLETTKFDAPAGWAEAMDFGLTALERLPRSKVSISARRVAVTAITDSAAEKAKIESDLTRRKPQGLTLKLDISAPRPVIAPFTTRFLIDEEGPRFDACSADSEGARRAILAAATEAGLTDADCTIGLGVPSPDWSRAVVAGIAAVADLGAGSVTFSDADVSLLAASSVSQADFDRVVGELDAGLPDVFSLKAVLTPRTDDGGTAGGPEFTATLGADGKVQLRGRLLDEAQRAAVESFARARFGAGAVVPATRLDENLPDGWPVRVLAALEALNTLTEGSVRVETDKLAVNGVTGDAQARATVARILSDRLGAGAKFDIAIRYDAKLDPLKNLPTPQVCAQRMNDILARAKIAFEPGAAVIAPSAKPVLDEMATAMKDCGDFPMEVGGHTDSQGSEEMNLALSQARAQAVIEALRDRRVLTSNLVAHGYGESRPIGDNETEAGRESNRRIEFRLIDDTATATAPDAAAGDEEPSQVPVYRAEEGRLNPKPRPKGLGQ